MIRMTVKDGSIVQTLTLDEEKVFVGRTDANTITLSDPSVSRKHCLIRRAGETGLEVLDLNSRHGTRRNGESIDRSPLIVGDQIDLGDVWIRIEALEGDPTPAPATEPESDGDDAPKDTTPARETKQLVSDAHRTSFGEELLANLRRTPWWAASLFLHCVVIYAFFWVPFVPVTDGSPLGRVDGRLEEDLSSLLEEELNPDEDIAPPEIDEPEDLPVPDDMDPVPDEMPEVEEEEDIPLPDIGPMPTDLSDAFRNSAGGTIALPDSAFGKDGAAGMNQKASGLLLGGRGGLSAFLRRLSKSDILVARGHYDTCEEVLHLLKLPHDCVPMVSLDRMKFDGRKVIVINCSNETLSKKTVERIRKWVKGGGYLLTTDWALANVVEPAFEDYLVPLRKNGRKVITPDEVIRIRGDPAKRRHFLLKGTTITDGSAKWWLEESSFPFEVKKPGEVEVLIRSDDLMAKYGVDPVAATFRYGKGRVLHMLGHVYQKEGNLKGTFSAQRLVANFLIAAVRKL
ncbi:MAG: FHA domain-containing protein [Planctomycetota bacterium]